MVRRRSYNTSEVKAWYACDLWVHEVDNKKTSNFDNEYSRHHLM